MWKHEFIVSKQNAQETRLGAMNQMICVNVVVTCYAVCSLAESLDVHVCVFAIDIDQSNKPFVVIRNG